jgi:hypothetical protein
MAEQLILKRASASRTSGEWNDDDFDVLADGAFVGRIFKVHAAPVGTPWMWTLAFGHHEDRTPTHGYEATREAAMAAFAKSWRREEWRVTKNPAQGMGSGRRLSGVPKFPRGPWVGTIGRTPEGALNDRPFIYVLQAKRAL